MILKLHVVTSFLSRRPSYYVYTIKLTNGKQSWLADAYVSVVT